MFLGGTCRYCKAPISYLYPLIEAITALTLFLLIHFVPSEFWAAYFIFFSALIVTIRTDLEQMLISRYVTLMLVPAGWILSALNWLPLTLYESVLGSLIGYTILYMIAATFKAITGKDGMGQGDLELLAFIGAFTGPLGCLVTLTIASTAGALFGLIYGLISSKKAIIVPFGPFLAGGAMIYSLFEYQLFSLF